MPHEADHRANVILLGISLLIILILLAVVMSGCALPGQSAALTPTMELGAGSTATQTTSSEQRTDHSLDAGRVQLGEKWQRLIGQGAACASMALLGMVLLMLVLDNPIKNPTWRFAVLMVAIAMLASPAVLLFGTFLR